MKNLLRTLPLPIGGVMLAFMSLAKLYDSFDIDEMSNVFLVVGSMILVLLVMKLIFATDTFVAELKNPVVASVAPMMTMGMMMFATIIHSQAVVFATIVWYSAALLQVGFIIYFIKAFIWKKETSLAHVYPSWFVTFVGVGMMPITAFGPVTKLMPVMYPFVFATYMILLPIVLHRLAKHALQEPTKPLFVILTAPGSLCLVGYLTVFHPQQVNAFVIGLTILSQLLYVVAVSQLPKLLTLPFYPSYAAFTFPLVISATACVKVSALAASSLLQTISYVEVVLATVIVLYVFVRYSLFLANGVKRAASHVVKA